MKLWLQSDTFKGGPPALVAHPHTADEVADASDAADADIISTTHTDATSAHGADSANIFSRTIDSGVYRLMLPLLMLLILMMLLVQILPLLVIMQQPSYQDSCCY